MKTKFGPLMELRKNDIRRCERELMQIENQIASKHSQIQVLKDEFYALEMPQGGSFAIYLTFEESKKLLLTHIDSVSEELEVLQIRKITLQEQYKRLHIEYEKINFLNKKEQDEALKKLKVKERIEVDEIAVMLYKNMAGMRQ